MAKSFYFCTKIFVVMTAGSCSSSSSGSGCGGNKRGEQCAQCHQLSVLLSAPGQSWLVFQYLLGSSIISVLACVLSAGGLGVSRDRQREI